MATDLKLIQKDTVDIVASKVREFQENGELSLPANYSAENAMKAAWLTLQETVDKDKKPVLETCTKNSIANALLNMVVQGLNPAKKQCYFVAYGNSLTLMRSYFGAIHVAKTVNPEISDIYADVVYEGDKLSYIKKHGKTIITEHSQELQNIKKEKIIAAYAVVVYNSDDEDSIIMTFDDIKKSWCQSKAYPVEKDGKLKDGTVHEKFTEEMAKRTVINKICKKIINTSDDETLLIKTFRKTAADVAEAEAQEEITDNANTIVVEAEIVDTDTGEVKKKTDKIEKSEKAHKPADEVDLP